MYVLTRIRLFYFNNSITFNIEILRPRHNNIDCSIP